MDVKIKELRLAAATADGDNDASPVAGGEVAEFTLDSSLTKVDDNRTTTRLFPNNKTTSARRSQRRRDRRSRQMQSDIIGNDDT